MKIVIDKLSLTFAPSIFTVFVFILGLIFVRIPESMGWPINAVWVLFFLNILSSVYVLVRLKKKFWLALLILLFLICLSFFISFLSIMTMTGDSI
jgi:hypothetical protein